mmetsp:Transcript_12286/g.30023  ORF Transcript_12286/g.30023 Transcript_12286/m.30023 type:complete len:93 (+) Transcript_12286:524-802(+)|eukprot:CAMPEP_0202859742 /NCGR_PEP_ID=MMETSP1391-20130828/1729_1 /ASSEMBLY_ACC=CAM_ASM_000867 /TAXON_ID=1034604 /ORGANISM="Chlamydomonas leiostraca, Strain SAG 11-49" /LENGTH=92 /DNA_ID=CAMNT_0049538811 /DNA_START=461 /DNA_END=739 /DNA_ORIENTATION=+
MGIRTAAAGVKRHKQGASGVRERRWMYAKEGKGSSGVHVVHPLSAVLVWITSGWQRATQHTTHAHTRSIHKTGTLQQPQRPRAASPPVHRTA